MFLVYLHGLVTVWLWRYRPQIRSEQLTGSVQHRVTGSDLNIITVMINTYKYYSYRHFPTYLKILLNFFHL